VLGHHERNILRHAVGVAELSTTVTEVTAAAADAGASVWFIGDKGEIAECVVLLGEIDPVTIRATNGDLEVKFDHLSERPAESNVTPVTRKKAYVPVWRPKLPVEWREELAALGLDLREIIREALAK